MVLEKTALGLQVLKDRSVPLTPQQRSAFILVDGKRTVEDILVATSGAGVKIDDIRQLVVAGVVAEMAAPAPAAPRAPQEGEAAPRANPEERYRNAYPLAVALTSSMGLRGVRLNMAVETAKNYEELLVVAAKIKEAVGDEKFEALRKALKG
jgi:hypothetical protein